MTDRIDIHLETEMICDKLGLDYPFVKRIVIEPQFVTAEVYEANAEGSKFILEDGTVALDTHTFAVAT